MNSVTFSILFRVSIVAFGLLLLTTTLISVCPRISEFDLKRIIAGFSNLLNNLAWGSKYIVKINEIWLLARGWEMKNGHVSVIFEPYKENVIGFKAGTIYEIADPSCRLKVPISWDNDDIYENIVQRNVHSLKEKHPLAEDSDDAHMAAPYPFHRLSRAEWRSMDEFQINSYINTYVRRYIFNSDEDDY